MLFSRNVTFVYPLQFNHYIVYTNWRSVLKNTLTFCSFCFVVQNRIPEVFVLGEYFNTLAIVLVHDSSSLNRYAIGFHFSSSSIP